MKENDERRYPKNQVVYWLSTILLHSLLFLVLVSYHKGQQGILVVGVGFSIMFLPYWLYTHKKQNDD